LEKYSKVAVALLALEFLNSYKWDVLIVCYE
jgi:hypothetical protein